MELRVFHDHRQNYQMDSVGVERQSSIEMEPRTLNITQIDFAREAALYVVKSRSIEEALSIFTEGLEPVGRSCAEGSGGSEQEIDDCRMDVAEMRDIVSAPF